MDEVSICNVKGHFSVSTPISVPNDIAKIIVHHGNFWTVRPPGHSKLVFVVFPASGHVNVSGIRNFALTHAATKIFEDLFDTKITSELHIDNSTASGRLAVGVGSANDEDQQQLQLTRLFGNLDRLAFPCTVSIRPHYFPSALLRPLKRALSDPDLISTSILFTNGKFIIVGSKTEAQVARTFQNLNQLVRAIA